MGLSNDELKVQELLAQKAELIRQIGIKNDTADTQITVLQDQFNVDKAAVLTGIDISAEQVALEKIEKKLTGKLNLDA